MTITVKIGHAKTHLSDLLQKAEAGEDVVIARGDNPVARLVPVRRDEAANSVVDEIIASRTGNRPASEVEIRAWRDAGRR